jgi:NTP pyrophosphatase (non-canonical NTP hydrolase)
MSQNHIIDEHIARIVKFCEDRDWAQFHDPKDLAISLSLEASEVLEHYQWRKSKEADPAKIAEELADVYYWVLLMSHYLDIDLPAAFEAKMKQNDAKYPVAKAKGKKEKYTHYEQPDPAATKPAT